MQDVSKILTRKYYGKKDPFRSREFRQPRWMELLAVLLFTVSGLGEGKSINVVLGGLRSWFSDKVKNFYAGQ